MVDATTRTTVAQRFNATRNPDQFTVSKFGPLIEATLERHLRGEVSDDDAGWDVEEQDRGNPVHHVCGAELPGCAEPLDADDIERLGEDEIAESKFLLELPAF